MLTLTEAASKKIKDIIAAEDHPKNETHLRVGVRGGGCAGLNFELLLEQDDKIDEASDFVYECHGVKVVTNEICLPYIDGTEIDYAEELKASGFKFNNPNTKTKCGCGSSFGV